MLTSRKPQIGIASTGSALTPCNMHINALADSAAMGADEAGGKAVIFNTITVADGISMGSPGMRYSLVSREVIADSIETVVGAEGFDGFVAIGGCDKNMPGCAMAMARLDRPSVFVYGGSIQTGQGTPRRHLGVRSGRRARGQPDHRRAAEGGRRHRDSRTRLVRRHVHREHDGLGDRSAGPVAAEQLRAGSGLREQTPRFVQRRRRGAESARARHQPVGHPVARGVRKRDHHRDRAGRVDERGAAPAGDRARGPDSADAR